MSDKVLVVGSGGREHAIASKLAQSSLVDTVYVNADWAHVTPKCVRYKTGSNEQIIDFAAENKVDLVVVGPELPLAQDIRGAAKKKGVILFGPGIDGVRLETSKCDAKDFMRTYNIPTSSYRKFSWAKDALHYIDNEWNGPVYVKADGLTEGKGALLGRTQDEAREAVMQIMWHRRFGIAGSRLVIEECMEGEEVTCSGMINSLSEIDVPFLFSQDHKRLNDDDEGPQTGGMGAYAPTTLVTKDVENWVNHKIFQRAVSGLHREEIDYTGFLYPGLMVKNRKAKVVEFNARLGDPETQPLLQLFCSDFYLAMQNIIGGRKPVLKWRDGYAVCVVLASKGYPDSQENEKLINGLDVERDNVTVFHAGTKHEGGKWYTNGGRVLGITAYGKTIKEAVDRVYAAIGKENSGVYFEDMKFRSDIGSRELRRAAFDY